MERGLSVAKQDNLISKDAVPPEIWRCSLFTLLYTRIVYGENNTYKIETRQLFLWLPGIASFILFFIWFAGIVADLSTSIIIELCFASGWMLLSPYLMGRTEYRLAGLLNQFAIDNRNARSGNKGWNLKECINQLHKINKLYWIVTSLSTVVFVGFFVIFDNLIASVLEIENITPPMLTFGAICMLITGFATGNGVWGLLKARKLYWTIHKSAEIDWYPFRVKQIAGLEQLTKDGFAVAIVFSFGAFFAPIALRIYFQTESNIKYIALVGVIVLVLGSAVLFTLITVIIYRLGKSSRENVLEIIADKIEYYLLCSSLEFMSEQTQIDSPEKPEMEFRDLLLLQNSIYSAETHSAIVSYLKNLFLVILIPICLTFLPQLLDLFF